MTPWLAIHPVSGQPPSQRLRSFECCCCGGGHLGRQWHNRDTDYGICPQCATEQAAHTPPERMRELYGIEGVHFITTTTTQKQS